MYGQRLKKIRKQLHLTAKEISTQFGISYRAYSSYERDERNPSFELLEKLAVEYKVNLNYFFTGVGEPFIPPQFEQVQDELALKVKEILKNEGIIK